MAGVGFILKTNVIEYFRAFKFLFIQRKSGRILETESSFY